MINTASPAAGFRVSLWGLFDVARFGELLLPRIHEVELKRRLPGLRMLPYAPLGPEHPVALDGGLGALALGDWTPERAIRLASAADVVIISGSDALTTDDEALAVDYGLSAEETRRRRLSGFFLEGPGPTKPMAWSAVGAPFEFNEADASRLRSALEGARYLSVRDEESRRRLERAAIEREVFVVPDPVALASRVFESDVLARRLDYLRLMEWFPRESSPLVVQGSRALVAHTEAISTALTESLTGRNIPVLLLETEPADGDGFVDALLPRLATVFRLPASASLVDILAVLSGARGFFGDSVHGHVAALSFGVPALFVSPFALPPTLTVFGTLAPEAAFPADSGNALTHLLGRPRAAQVPESIGVRLDRHFDALAEVTEKALLERLEREDAGDSRKGMALLRALEEDDRRLEIMGRALDVQSEHVAATRLFSAEQVERMESQLDGASREAESLRGHLASLQAERDRLENELGLASKEAESLRGQLASLQAERNRLGNELGLASKAAESLRGQLAQRLGELEAMRAEFVRFTNLRLFRYTAPLRSLYAALRRFLGLKHG